MQEIEKRIGLLRLLQADIHSKQAQLAEMEGQYRAQLSRIVEFVVYREGDVANALSLMSEVQGKLDEVVQTTGHLKMIAEKVTMELDVLVLTKRVAEARSQLMTLEDRRRELSARLSHVPGTLSDSEARDLEGEQKEELRTLTDEVSEVANEITRLHNLITEASERAARSIQLGESPRP